MFGCFEEAVSADLLYLHGRVEPLSKVCRPVSNALDCRPLKKIKLIFTNLFSIHAIPANGFTYGCETFFNVSLHLHVNSFGHIHFAVFGVSFKDYTKVQKFKD